MTGSESEDSKLPRKYVGSYRMSVGLKDNQVYVGTTVVFEKQKDFYVLNTGADIYLNPRGRSPVIPLWFSLMNRVSLHSEAGRTSALIASFRYKWLMNKESKTVYYAGFSVDFPYSGLAMKSKGAYELFPAQGRKLF
jgi:hypothetical protein